MKFNWLKPQLLFSIAIVFSTSLMDVSSNAQDVDKKSDGSAIADFDNPVQLKGGDEFIRVESPGYAAPSLADMNGDGRKDLIVGQFSGGKMKIYTGLGDGKFSEGEWLEVDGKPAVVPGVW